MSQKPTHPWRRFTQVQSGLDDKIYKARKKADEEEARLRRSMRDIRTDTAPVFVDNRRIKKAKLRREEEKEE